MKRKFNRRHALHRVSQCLAIPPLARSAYAAGTGNLSVEDYMSHDGLGLAELVRNREVSARDLVETSLKRIEAVEPRINSIAGTLADAAFQSIDNGIPDGQFHGVPFLIKDLSFSLRGEISDFGSKLFSGRRAQRDSTAVERYRKSGLVLIARTRVPELGILPTTESTHGGITRNPYGLNRTAGGSSGGSAAAVAAGIAPWASASDGGGSIRIPASCCGLFGLKPTRARIPLGPDKFEAWGGLATIHAITRSVRDSAALLDATAGFAVGDSYAAPKPSSTFLSAVSSSPKPLRIALVKTMPPTEAIDPECEQALMETSRLCEQLGHRVEDCTDELGNLFDFEALRTAHGIVVLVAVRRVVQTRLTELQRELRDSDLEPVTRYYHDFAANYTGVQVEDSRAAFFKAARQMGEFQRNYDVILSPTTATPPIAHGVITLTGWAQEVVDGLLKFIPSTPLANWTGQPAMSVPLHISSQGLPLGMQFMGRFGDETTLFQLAGQLEQAHPWIHRRPSFSDIPS
ncbi:MAG: amidase [Planctomycetota bacterium]